MLFPDKKLKIDDIYGDLIACIITTMPKEIRDRALGIFRRIFSPLLKSTDSSEESGGFLALHLSYYNRFAKQVRYIHSLVSNSG
jgi:hypothetical protein